MPSAAPGESARSTIRWRSSPWLGDVAWSALCGAVATALLLRSGGIWEHVNSGDLHASFVPKYEYAAHALLWERRLPLWNPNEFCGLPLLGVGQGAVLYPPVLILFGALPSWTALQAFYACHIFLLAWATTTYLRSHGIGRISAALAALLSLVGVFRSVYWAGVDHPSFLASVAWVPVMLHCSEKALRHGARPWLAFLGLAALAQWLAGYPDFPIDVAVLLTLVAIVGGTGPLARRLGVVVGGLALGAALAAVQILPILETVAESPRIENQGLYAFWRSAFAFYSPANLAGQLVRQYGPAALAAAALGCWRPTLATAAWLAAFAWATFALTFPFSLLYKLPPYSGVRFPLGWSNLAGVFLGLLAAASVTNLWRQRSRWSRALALGLGVATAAQGLAFVAGAPGSLPPFAARSPAFRAPDQTLVAQRLPALRALQGDQPRILSEREATSGAALRNNLRIPNGHEGSPPRRIVQLLTHVNVFEGLGLFRGRDWDELARHPDVGALLGIGIAVVPQGTAGSLLGAGFTPRASLPPADVVLERPAVPRARLVHRVVEVAANDQATLAEVLAHAGEASRVAIVEAGALDAALTDLPPGVAEEVRIVRDEPEQVVLQATVGAPALLVLTDTFFPGWEATVDGARAPILRADHAFRGVRLHPGRHRIAFRYAPRSVRLGATITALAVIIVVLILLRLPGRHTRQLTVSARHMQAVDRS